MEKTNWLCLGEDGLYYPDLRLPEGTHYEIGRYGRIGRVSENIDHRIGIGDGTNEYLHQTDEECYQMMERLVDWQHGAGDQQWVAIDNIRHCAKRVLKMVYVMLGKARLPFVI